MSKIRTLVFALTLAVATAGGGGVALADPYVDPAEIPCFGGTYCDGAGPGFPLPPNPWDPTNGQDPRWGDFLQAGFNELWDTYVAPIIPVIENALGCAWDC